MENIFSMFNAGLCSSDVHCGHACENYDTEHGHVKSQYSARTKTGQGTWQCGLHTAVLNILTWAKVSATALFLLQLIALERVPYTTHNNHHYKLSLNRKQKFSTNLSPFG